MEEKISVHKKIRYAIERESVTLDLSNEEITSIPSGVFEILWLQNLDLSKNNLSAIPKEILLLKKLTKLNLSDNRFEEFPETITQARTLATLNLSNNLIKKLPKEICQLKDLTTLNLKNNQLNSLPESISELEKLSFLDLSNNRFADFPNPIASLENLTDLELNNNNLTSIPKSISGLQKLTALRLNGNHEIYLPETLSRLKELATLELSDNNLVKLPESVLQATNLKQLNLSKNKIEELPEAIGNLTLYSLSLGDNPLRIPPPEIASKGFYAVKQYFQQLKDGQDHIYEAKLLILGEGGAGKTTLAFKIIDPSYQLKDEKSTQGIEVLPWSFFLDDGRPFRVNIWDFGGQEIYHTTHQFFLTKRSMYILVADTRNEDTDFYYWLNIIELLSDNSPLIIVKNEKQDRHREINERQLHGQFENLRGILSANLATNRGIDKIHEEIEHLVINLPHIGTALPTTWIRVREFFENDKRNYVGLEEFLEICRQQGFDNIKDSLQLSGYLHDLGVFLHFQEDPLLRKTVILKPKWGTDAVYKVLDNKEIIRNLGCFNRAQVSSIWGEQEYANMQEELLQLMIKFKLCYKIPDAEGIYIAPQLLTENEPEYEWDEKENLLIRYTYEFMPKGILTQFIVVMHTDIWEHKHVWKSGVILKKDNTFAEVIEYYGKRELHIRIAGAHKKELLTIVLHELDKIHATYRRLKYDKLVPCNCLECKDSQEKFFYKFERLKKFVEDRQTQIQCQQSYLMVNVFGLIDDIIPREEMQVETDTGSQDSSPTIPANEVQSQALDKRKTLLIRILHFTFIAIPKNIGRFILDMFGRDKATDITAIILGYIVILIVVSIIKGVINPGDALNTFKDIWRFFFPTK